MKTLEIALITVGLACLLAYAGARAHGEFERRAAVASFSAVPTPERRELDVPAPDRAEWSENRRAAYAAAERGSPLAVLRVPTVGIEVPVFGDTSEPNLNRGAGYIEGTAFPGADGNSGIAAHRDGYFRALRHVELGDVITVEHAHGSRDYAITDLTIVEPTDVHVLDPTETAALTLVTCYPFYFVGNAPQRYIVRAVAIN